MAKACMQIEDKRLTQRRRETEVLLSVVSLQWLSLCLCASVSKILKSGIAPFALQGVAHG
jgi:hypothetical protein